MPQTQRHLHRSHKVAEEDNMVSSIEIESASSSLLDTMTEQPKPESSFSLKQSKIRFSEKLEEYHYIPSRNDFSERELRHCWYTEEEKAKYIERHERSSKRLENGERSKRGESFRGLEGWTQDGADEANEMIEECLDAVLHEQQRQWRKNRRNPINLALISESKSKKSIKMALRTAKRDTKEALRAYERMGIEDLDLESATSSISSLMASMPASSSSVEDSDENEPDKPRRTEKREGKRRSTSKRRSSAYRSRGEHRRSKSTSSSTSRGVERIQKAIALE